MSDQNKQLNTQNSIYHYKKTEKLVSALYLLTSFISDKEPVKWQLRETGLKLLYRTMSLSQGADLNQENSFTLISLILSFLTAAYLGGIISEMNHGILKYEFDILLRAVEAEEKERLRGAVLPADFLAVENIPVPDLTPAPVRLNSKGHKDMSDTPTRSMNVIREQKSNRQEIIIDLLRKDSGLGIKEFVTAIKGCSEKTIQRELASLVSKGQIKKDGEKRWSRYSLK